VIICGWELNHNRTVAILRDENVSVVLSEDGRTVSLEDHTRYYASNGHEIPLAVIEALRPGGIHPDTIAKPSD